MDGKTEQVKTTFPTKQGASPTAQQQEQLNQAGGVGGAPPTGRIIAVEESMK